MASYAHSIRFKFSAPIKKKILLQIVYNPTMEPYVVMGQQFGHAWRKLCVSYLRLFKKKKKKKT
jgi:hypothetical protein